MKIAIATALMFVACGAALAQGPVRARDIVKEFHADKATAMKKYSRQPIVVTGEIRRINLNQFGTGANTILDGNDIFEGLSAWFAEGNAAAQTVAVGQTVTLRCTFDDQNMQVHTCYIQR